MVAPKKISVPSSYVYGGIGLIVLLLVWLLAQNGNLRFISSSLEGAADIATSDTAQEQAVSDEVAFGGVVDNECLTPVSVVVDVPATKNPPVFVFAKNDTAALKAVGTLAKQNACDFKNAPSKKGGAVKEKSARETANNLLPGQCKRPNPKLCYLKSNTTQCDLLEIDDSYCSLESKSENKNANGEYKYTYICSGLKCSCTADCASLNMTTPMPEPKKAVEEPQITPDTY